MPEEKHVFGGAWTTEKIDILKNYLQAYVTALKKQRFTLYYIDAFAGTGYREEKSVEKREDTEILSLLPEMTEPDLRQFFEGSVRVALQVEPPFDRYIFIENKYSRCAELELLKSEFSTLSERISVVNQEANQYLHKLCYNNNWAREGARGVLFLDPYGMQVEWETVRAIASSKAIDVWYLFPVMAVNRLLKRDSVISEANRKRLDLIFGTSDWGKEFYRKSPRLSLFQEDCLDKIADVETLKNFMIDRLEEVFSGVATNPKVLYNSKNSPLFLFCFAVATDSPKGIDLALRIAEAILGKRR